MTYIQTKLEFFMKLRLELGLFNAYPYPINDSPTKTPTYPHDRHNHSNPGIGFAQMGKPEFLTSTLHPGKPLRIVSQPDVRGYEIPPRLNPHILHKKGPPMARIAPCLLSAARNHYQNAYPY